MPDRRTDLAAETHECVRCHGTGKEPINADVTVNGLPLSLGQLRHLLYRVFWKQTSFANLNTVQGCEQAATVAADYLSWLSADDAVSPTEMPRWDGKP